MTELWEAALVYLDQKTPWRDRGRSLQGVDCIGLVISAARDIGIELDEKNELDRTMDAAVVTRVFAKSGQCYRVTLQQALPGDIVYFGLTKTTMIGIIAPPDTTNGPLTIIHTPFSSCVQRIPFDERMGNVRGVVRLKKR